MTNFDMNYFYFFADRFFGGSRFFLSSGFSRVIESENQIQLRSNCELTEGEMTIFTNTAATAFQVGIRKNGDGVNDPTKDASTISWIANETGTKTFAPSPIFYLKDDKLCLRMSGIPVWSPNFVDFRIRFRLQFLPVP